MQDRFTTYSSPFDLEPLHLEAVPQVVHPATGSRTFPRAAIPADAAVRHRFMNEQLNSRSNFPLGLREAKAARSLQIVQQIDLDSFGDPYGLLWTAGRTVVLSSGRFPLFDAAGRCLASWPSGGPFILGVEAGVAYHRIHYGAIQAYRLSDGGEAFSFLLQGAAENHAVDFMACRGRRLISVSEEVERDPHSGRNPENYSIEVTDLGDPAHPKSWNEPGGARVIRGLTWHGPQMTAAMDRESIVLAVPDRLYWADLDLKIHRILAGSFAPITMSLDEAGRVYLRESASYGKEWLQIITPEAEQLARVELPFASLGPFHPPIVDYDHRIYILKPDRALAYSIDGKTLWEVKTPGEPVGAIATADDFLLVSTKQALITIDAEGKLTPLHEFPGEELATPPILTGPGEILVASSKRLYRLSVSAAPTADAGPSRP
jgi:hypothetical protein